MQRARIPQDIRRTIVVGVLVTASAAASAWRMTPHLSPATRVTVNLFPALFTSAMAQTSTGCSGTPKPNDADLGGESGVLAIAMNSIKLVDYGPNNASGGGDDVETELLSGTPPTPVDLNFASTSGSNVGSFASNVAVAAGTYEALKITVDNVFRIKCAVTCSGTTYRTQGGTSLTSPDGTALPAQTSSVAPTSSDSEASFPFATPLVVTSGGSTSKNIGYAASGACELWDLGSGNFKIMPKSLTASIQ